jgi:hypothetical protein
MNELRQPKSISVECQDGTSREYVISKLPALVGMKIVMQGPVMATPKIGDYAKFEALSVEMLGYVEAVLPNGHKQRLSTPALIDNHVPDWEALARLNKEMVAYNVSFFQNGKLSDFFAAIAEKANTRLAPMLASLQRSLSESGTPPSAN